MTQIPSANPKRNLHFPFQKPTRKHTSNPPKNTHSRPTTQIQDANFTTPTAPFSKKSHSSTTDQQPKPRSKDIITKTQRKITETEITIRKKRNFPKPREAGSEITGFGDSSGENELDSRFRCHCSPSNTRKVGALPYSKLLCFSENREEHKRGIE